MRTNLWHRRQCQCPAQRASGDPESGDLWGCQNKSIHKSKGGLRTGIEDVLEANIKCRVRMGGECVSVFPGYVFRLSVLVAYGVLDLKNWALAARACN